MQFLDLLDQVRAGHDLERNEAELFLSEILDNDDISNEIVADALMVLTKKTETNEEILGFLSAMKSRMTTINAPNGSIDTCGTGGDRSGTFNISTASAIVLAAGGVPVAKHGNRSASSKCGSADVLEQLGINLDLSQELAEQKLRQQNFVFLFAQKYHPALKKLAIVRKSLGFPTVFNLLGPLLNPAGVKRQVIGTFTKDNARRIAEIVLNLNYEHCIVLVSEDGLDEASISAQTKLFEIKGSNLTKIVIAPENFGLEPAEKSELLGDDAETNAKIIEDVVNPNDSFDSRQRVVILNAGIGFYVSGQSKSIQEGVEKAKQVISSGKAKQKLNALRDSNV